MPFQLKPLPDHHKKSSTPQGPNKFATIVSEEAKRLIAMDRYERRALFRREIAIQAAKNFRVLRRRGVTVRKTIDTMIATRCIESGYDLLHSDRAFDPFAIYLGLRVVS